MKKFIEKIGLDKIAHLGVGGLLCACITLVMILQDADILLHGSNIWRALLTPFIGTVVVMVFELHRVPAGVCCSRNGDIVLCVVK